ncbi:MAG TPA: ergothioneine biosynthesis protein EgtB [Planctomycetaceae bacterium]|jgi:ergothioneine biosynthesis protein EgtB|nr:ergothioneine biosynthesis protein EgtB [Planctomycetaceae bacterium]
MATVPIVANLAERYSQTRRWTERLCEPLAVEDFVVQSMPDASPTRWHLAHTTWFFETFVLARSDAAYRPANSAFQSLFNSYYNSLGEAFPRARRGLLTRPTVAEVFEYRHIVDERMAPLLIGSENGDLQDIARIIELGIHHEQQHQELMLTDIKHMYSCNPLWPAYRRLPHCSVTTNTGSSRWSAYDGGVVEIGHVGGAFGFDNEFPRHKTLLQAFEICNRLVTTGEFLEFVKDDGYRRPDLWLSLGWSIVREQQWAAPLYWVERNGNWNAFTLGGLVPLNADQPICHVSYFEADAFARWSGARLPTEAEWERAATDVDVQGSFVESEHFHPAALESDHDGLEQMYGEVWQWTASPYLPYPGFVPPSGALGEYNAKFMCNQYVLRGGSCATPRSHIRRTYRNFFPPEARWQFTGIRLARDAQ